MISDEHKNLVDILVKALINGGYIIERADSENYSRAPKIGRHEPDIVAKTTNGLIMIGEAKTKDDLNSETSKEQFIDFSNRVMATGLLKGKAVPFHIIVKKDAVEELRNILIYLGLGNKIGNIITIWTL